MSNQRSKFLFNIEKKLKINYLSLLEFRIEFKDVFVGLQGNMTNTMQFELRLYHFSLQVSLYPCGVLLILKF